MNKAISTPTFMPSDVTVCREYQHEACCTLDTVRKVPTQTMADLYGAEYSHALCNITGLGASAMSSACKAYFDAENCFYECDKNVGKFRRFDTCNEEDADVQNHNAWEIEAMPISSSVADGMFQACKDDYFPNGKSIWGSDANGWVSWEGLVNIASNGTNIGTGTCVKASEIWTDGKDMVETLWSGSFKYEEDSSKAYVWSFAEGSTNPNNAKLPEVKYPPMTCAYHANIGASEILNASQTYPDYCPVDWHLDENSGHSLAVAGNDMYKSSSSTKTKLIAFVVSSIAAMFVVA